MSDWTQGYVADIEYLCGFFKELTPAHLAFALAANRCRPPAHERPFTYCELGFGQGFTINLLAAANPHGEFWGTDFNPSHAAHATHLARNAGGSNLKLFDLSFDEFLEQPTPQFDFIVLHGVYSWINPENRHKIVEFIGKKLKCGGAVYVSYNTLPGWSAVMPLRELMLRHAALSSEPTAARVEKALAFARRVAESKAAYFQANLGVQPHLDGMMEQNRRYLAHEYFNDSWNPQYFSEVSLELSAAKVNWVASARLEEQLAMLTLTPDAQKLLSEISDPNLRETVRDFSNNTKFRRDIFVKGPLRMHSHEQHDVLARTRFALVVPRSDLKLVCNFGVGDATLSADIYNPIADALSKGPRSIGELTALPELKRVAFSSIAQALCVLVASEQANPCLSAEGEDERHAACKRFNEVILDQAKYSDELKALASPVTGSGRNLNRTERLILDALRRKADPVKDVWEILSSQNQFLIKDGKRLTTPDENLAALKNGVNDFMEKMLPVLRHLKIV